MWWTFVFASWVPSLMVSHILINAYSLFTLCCDLAGLIAREMMMLM